MLSVETGKQITQKPLLLALPQQRSAKRRGSLSSLSTFDAHYIVSGVQGAIELARLLVSCPCLASLNLRGCGLHQEGGAAIGAALPEARQLRRLDLSANRCAASRCAKDCCSIIITKLRCARCLHHTPYSSFAFVP